MMNNGMPTRILKAIAKVTGNWENLHLFYIWLFSDGSGSVVFSNMVYKTKPHWCKSLITSTNHDYCVFRFLDWDLESAFVEWYEDNFKPKSRDRLVEILTELGV
jgi:hypothetical protein